MTDSAFIFDIEREAGVMVFVSPIYNKDTDWNGKASAYRSSVLSHLAERVITQSIISLCGYMVDGTIYNNICPSVFCCIFHPLSRMCNKGMCCYILVSVCSQMSEDIYTKADEESDMTYLSVPMTICQYMSGCMTYCQFLSVHVTICQKRVSSVYIVVRLLKCYNALSIR